jgi:RND family efflux transporter MFP subunit
MKNLMLLAGIPVYLVFMTACAGGHGHDHDDDHTHATTETHSHEAGEKHDHGSEGSHTHEEGDQHDHGSEGSHTHEEGEGHDHDHGETATGEKVNKSDPKGSFHVHPDGTIHYDEPVKGAAAAAKAKEDDHDHEGETIPEHTAIKLKKQDFSFIVRAGGTILPDSKDVINVTSKTAGIVRLTDHFLFPGMKVKKGTPLFIISGDELTSDNTELALTEAKSDYDRAKAMHERAERLIVNKLITMDHYLGVKNDYEKATVRYNNLRAAYSANGNVVTAPADGFINQVYITEGTKVTTGETLLSVIIEHNLVLKADVSPQHIARLGEVQHANFRMVYDQMVYRTDEMNGKKISYARSTGANSFYIPLYFSIDFHPGLVPGTYAEVWLRGAPRSGCIVVPNTAILEEFGKFFVYVEDANHHFVKRYISRGMTNGTDTEVVEGLAENEIVVATGAYAIKMSQMSTTAPDTHKH